MKITENKNYEGFYTTDGWWICPEDAVYNDLYDELISEADPSEALLEDTFHKDLTSPLAFVLAYVPWKQGSTLETADAHEKRPAMLLFRLASDNGYYAFQLTTTKQGGKLDQFKFNLSNPSQYGLKLKDNKSSYINYAHLVKVRDQNLLYSLRSTLSHDDCRDLYKCLTEQYKNLSAINNPNSMFVYNRLIKLLEAHLDIAAADSFFAKKKTDDKKSDEKKAEKTADDTAKAKSADAKTDKTDQPAKTDRPDKTDTTDKTDKADKAAKTDQAVKTDTTIKANQTAETDQAAKTSVAAKTDPAAKNANDTVDGSDIKNHKK